jgi:GNAT superfamily N-acetyltransferase
VPLTPQQLADFQRLRQSYAPVLEAQRRKQQAQGNLEKMHGLPPVKPQPKADGGSAKMSKEVGNLHGIKNLSFEDYAPNEVELVNLEAHEQGKGHGSNAMQKITSAADKHKINLMLIPAGDKSKRDRLSDFYGRFGFSDDGDVMRRRHKAKGGRVTHAHHLEIEERPL